MPDVFITLEEAAAFESVSYKTLTQRIYRNPQQYKTKSQAREGGGKDQVLISTSSLSAKARKAWRAAQKVEGSEVIIDKRAQEAVPWYVTADLNQYTEANKKRFYEAVELAARVQDFIDYDGPDRTGYAERYALGLGISPQSLYRYMKNVLEANAWALKLEKEDGKSRDYRTRLSMKGIISQWSGTRRGVLYALTALGYDRSRIELFAERDAERWAEFIIFLNSSKPSGVTNLSVIDAQVRKVKEGSSKPAYGMETIGGLIIRSQLQTGFSRYPRCGEIVCGVWPHIVSEGRLVVSTVMAQGGASGGDNPFPRAGTFAASEEFYHFGAYTIYQGFASDIEAGSKAAQGAKVYLRCSASTRCSTNAKGDAAE